MRSICGAVVLALLVTACGGRTTPPADAGTRLTDQQYAELEKTIGSEYASLQKQLAGRQLPDAAASAQVLAESFGEAERFWAHVARADAVRWTQTERTLATQAAAAASAGNAQAASKAVADMEVTCKQCHTYYREADAAGGYRINWPAVKK